MLAGLLEQTNTHTYIAHMILLANVGGGGRKLHDRPVLRLTFRSCASKLSTVSSDVRSFCWWNMSREFVDFLNKFKFQLLPTFKFRVSYFMLAVSEDGI